eukprot:4984424-Amphidinium_carterae.1
MVGVIRSVLTKPSQRHVAMRRNYFFNRYLRLPPRCVKPIRTAAIWPAHVARLLRKAQAVACKQMSAG